MAEYILGLPDEIKDDFMDEDLDHFKVTSLEDSPFCSSYTPSLKKHSVGNLGNSVVSSHGFSKLL